MREVYESIDSDVIYIVPNFISEGYFCQQVLPRELRLTGPTTLRDGKTIHYCDPVGIHPNMTRLLLKRAEAGRPIRVAQIGAGKFGSMFLHQARRTAGMHVAGIADLSIRRARAALARIHWPDGSYDAASLDDAIATGGTHQSRPNGLGKGFWSAEGALQRLTTTVFTGFSCFHGSTPLPTSLAPIHGPVHLAA